MGVRCVPGYSRFPQRGGFGVWNFGSEAWKGRFGTELMLGWRGWVLQWEGCLHSLHRVGEGRGKVGLYRLNNEELASVNPTHVPMGL